MIKKFIAKYNFKTLKKQILDSLFDESESNLRKSLSIALGIFVGISPIWGYHLLSAAALAHLLRLNKVLTLLATNISIPPLTPFVLYFSYILGGWLLNKPNANFDSHITLDFLKQNLIQYLTGSITLGILMAIVVGSLSFLLFQVFRKPKTVE